MILKRRAMLGFEPEDDKHISVLNRLLTIATVDGQDCLKYEPDPWHAEILVSLCGLMGVHHQGSEDPKRRRLSTTTSERWRALTPKSIDQGQCDSTT